MDHLPRFGGDRDQSELIVGGEVLALEQAVIDHDVEGDGCCRPHGDQLIG